MTRSIAETMQLLHRRLLLEVSKGLHAVDGTILSELQQGSPRPWVRLVLDVRVEQGDPAVGVVVQLESEQTTSGTGG